MTLAAVTSSAHSEPRRLAFVVAAASAAGALFAWMLFAGAYLPYTDWSKHAALMEIFVHGDETGAAAYWERTLRPTPYWTFYVAVASVSAVTGLDTDLAGRLVLALAAALCVLAHAHLLRQCSRDVRWCVLAPVALLGLPLGYGFGSFLCATPAALFAFARTEALLERPDARRTALLAAALVLVLLGHGLWVLAVALAVVVRAATFVVAFLRRNHIVPWRTLGRGAVSVLPATLLGLTIAARPVPPAEHFPDLWVGAPLAERLAWMKRALVGQFVEPQVALVVASALALCGVMAAVLARRSAPSRNDVTLPGGLETYALVLLLIALLGPKSLGGPIQVYLIYPRFLAVALVLVLCAPRVRLHGARAWLLVACMAAVPVYAAHAQRAVVQRASAAAADFDGVRRMVPRSSRVLALWAPDAHDALAAFPGFWPAFWLGVDGARFSTGLFDYAAHPVFRRKHVQAPLELRGLAFRPDVHGAGWDYVVVRGSALVARLDAARSYAPVGASGGYHVYRNTALVPEAPNAAARSPASPHADAPGLR